MATNTLSNLLLFASGAFTLLHGIALVGRVFGSNGEAQAAVANNLRGITGNNATTAAQQEIDDVRMHALVPSLARPALLTLHLDVGAQGADATMRIITNAVAFTGHCTGALAVRSRRQNRGQCAKVRSAGLVGIQGYRGRTDAGKVAPVALKAVRCPFVAAVSVVVGITDASACNAVPGISSLLLRIHVGLQSARHSGACTSSGAQRRWG